MATTPLRASLPPNPGSDPAALAAAGPRAPAANDAADPLEACLLFLLEHHGRALSLAALRATVVRSEQRWAVGDFVEAAESLGLATRSQASALPPDPAPHEPVLVPQDNGKAFLLLARHGPDDHEIYDPALQRTLRIGAAALQARYRGSFVQVTPPLRAAGGVPAAAPGRRGHWFWGPIRLATPLYVRGALAAVLTSVFALASSIFSMIVYDRVIPNNSLDTLYALLGGVAIVLASDFAIRLVRGYVLDVAGARADVEIADAVFDQVLDLDMQARRGSAGGLASLLREYESIREFFTSATMATLIDLPFALLFVVVLYWVGGPMAWVPVVAIPLMLGAGLLLQPALKRQSQVSQEDSQVKQAVLVEALSGLETIKALGAAAVVRRRWQEAVTHQARVAMQTRLLGALATHWTQLVFMVSQVAVVTVGVFLAAKGQVGTGAIVAGSILCGRAIQPLAQLAQLLLRLNQVLASYRAIDRVMKMPREHPPGLVRTAHASLRGSIELRDVGFRYADQATKVLDNVSLRIEPGERVAIIGRVGSGKTTLVKLLLGLHAPTEGTLLVGGHDIRQIDPADLRRNVGSVLQDLWLMSGTLRQNIALGADRPGDAEVLRAAGIAGVDEFAAQHPQGYQMRVGEAGEGLSGGQRQAVALARALIGEPAILLLDEPTSAMDPAAERALLQRLALATQGKTLVVVTHKPSMLDLVDRIIVLERGKVVANGPKDVVLRARQAGKEVS